MQHPSSQHMLLDYCYFHGTASETMTLNHDGPIYVFPCSAVHARSFPLRKSVMKVFLSIIVSIILGLRSIAAVLWDENRVAPREWS